MVPDTVADARTDTGEPTVEPFTGWHTFKPGEPGALQPVPMVYAASPTSLCEKPEAVATA
jgi:hypothetical protein